MLEELQNTFRYDQYSGRVYCLKSWGRKPAGRLAARKDRHGYFVVFFKRKPMKASRLAMILTLGRLLATNEIVDHIDGNTSNDKITNLRLTTLSGNQQNRPEHRKGRPIGVAYHKQTRRWQAVAPQKFLLRCESTRKYLGLFKTKEEAGEAVIAFCSGDKR